VTILLLLLMGFAGFLLVILVYSTRKHYSDPHQLSESMYVRFTLNGCVIIREENEESERITLPMTEGEMVKLNKLLKQRYAEYTLRPYP